jgi:hypothetical protein
VDAKVSCEVAAGRWDESLENETHIFEVSEAAVDTELSTESVRTIFSPCPGEYPRVMTDGFKSAEQISVSINTALGGFEILGSDGRRLVSELVVSVELPTEGARGRLGT